MASVYNQLVVLAAFWLLSSTLAAFLLSLLDVSAAASSTPPAAAASSSSSSSVDIDQLLEQDKQALLRIRDALAPLNRTTVAAQLADWDSGSSSDACGWSRVTCTNDGSAAAAGRRVTGLNLSSLFLSGELTSLDAGFSNLTALLSLNLSRNELGGGLSEDIARSTGLEELDLSYNNLTTTGGGGRLGRLSGLRILRLSANNISGPLSGLLPPTSSSFPWARLSFLDLSSNSLSGPLSPFPWHLCTSLRFLNLSYNSLFGPLPLNLTRLPSLHYLSLSTNNLSGDPSPLCPSPSLPLVFLDLSANLLYGPFPPSLPNCPSLAYLDLSSNKLSGDLPLNLANLTRLGVFMAGSNQLTGLFPQELLTSCRNLFLLDLNSNSLAGELPDLWDGMLALKYIVLHSNAFSGRWPNSLLKLSGLQFLDLSNNSLSGVLPPQIGNMSSLQFLLVAANHFTDEIPPSLGTITGLQFLDLSSNHLTGPIPSSLGNLQDLLWLMLAYNNLTGDIPRQLGNCSSLLWLNLKSNSLSGSIPSEFALMGQNPGKIFTSNRQTMNPPKALGECLMLRRWIPEDYQPYSFIYQIINDRSRCKSFWINLVTGEPLARACPRSPKLGGYIQLTNNKLTGSIPSSYQANQTTILLLGLNYFTGTLPGALGQLALVNLNVSHNTLSGSIPDTLGTDNKCLSLLDLSYNNFSGNIPSSLGGLTQLSRFNVSFNPLLNGSIPATGQFLTFTNSSYINDSLLCLEQLSGMRANYSSSNLPFCTGSTSFDLSSSQAATSSTQTVKLSSEFIIVITVSCIAVLVCIVFLLHVVWAWPDPTPSKDSFVCEKFVDDSFSSNYEDFPSTVCLFKPGSCASDAAAIDPLQNQLHQQKHFGYADILLATDNFAESHVIGSGGYGVVYKAKLPDGTTLAIKKLVHSGCQGGRQFIAEMETVGTLAQENLVPLLGCCIFGPEKLLVYKYICNGSLDVWLHEKEEGPQALSWPIRLKIACGCARALRYLHHDCSPGLIHRDMKSSNILLDEEFNAYVTDFGLARELDPACTHVSTVVAGTLGYVPPEYCHTWRATTKGDVYSFGVVMLELITGRRPLCFAEHQVSNNNINMDGCGNLVEWVRMLLKGSSVAEAYHRVVKQTAPRGDEELLEFIELANACTQDASDHRPTMKKVARDLQNMQEQYVAS